MDGQVSALWDQTRQQAGCAALTVAWGHILSDSGNTYSYLRTLVPEIHLACRRDVKLLRNNKHDPTPPPSPAKP